MIGLIGLIGLIDNHCLEELAFSDDLQLRRSCFLPLSRSSRQKDPLQISRKGMHQGIDPPHPHNQVENTAASLCAMCLKLEYLDSLSKWVLRRVGII